MFDELFKDSLPPPPAPVNKRRKLEKPLERGVEFAGIWNGVVEAGESGEEATKERAEKVGKVVLARLLEVAGGKETGEVARRRMYALYSKWGDEI